MYNYSYLALIHGKWKQGVCEVVKDRFKGYNKGNFNFYPCLLHVIEEGHEEQVSILETKILANLYDYLENPDFYTKPTEYVDPKFEHIDENYIKNIIEEIIKENNLNFRKVKEEFLKESTKDHDFLEKIRMFPEKYLEGF